MNYEQMLYLVELYRTNSMTQAASNLFVSQSTISKSMKNLQNSLGTELFHATKSGVTFTNAGSLIARRAKRFLSDLNHFNTDIEDIVRQDTYNIHGNLTIAGSILCQELILPWVIPSYLSLYPNVSLKTVLLPGEDILGFFNRDDLDILIMPSNDDLTQNIQTVSNIKCEFLCNYQLCAAMRTVHPLCRRQTVTFSELCYFPWISVNSKYDDFAFFNPTQTEKNTIHPQVILKTTSLTQALQTVAKTDAIVITSNFTRVHHLVQNGAIAMVPIRNAGTYVLSAFYNLNSPKINLIKNFIRHINLN